jgi:hypothetical protein
MGIRKTSSKLQATSYTPGAGIADGSAPASPSIDRNRVGTARRRLRRQVLWEVLTRD